MKNLTLTLDSEISLLSKYKLTADELLLIRSLLILQDEDDEHLFQNLIEVFKCNGLQLRELLISLQDKGIILKTYKIEAKGSQFDPFDIQINKNFIKSLYKGSFELGKELFENYPQFGSIQGNIVGLRSVSRKFNSLEDAYFKYGRSIGWSIERHNHIIELLKWASERNIINYTLASFIIDQRWLELEALKEGDLSNINYDTVKLI